MEMDFGRREKGSWTDCVGHNDEASSLDIQLSGRQHIMRYIDTDIRPRSPSSKVSKSTDVQSKGPQAGAITAGTLSSTGGVYKPGSFPESGPSPGHARLPSPTKWPTEMSSDASASLTDDPACPRLWVSEHASGQGSTGVSLNESLLV